MGGRRRAVAFSGDDGRKEGVRVAPVIKALISRAAENERKRAYWPLFSASLLFYLALSSLGFVTYRGPRIARRRSERGRERANEPSAFQLQPVRVRDGRRHRTASNFPNCAPILCTRPAYGADAPSKLSERKNRSSGDSDSKPNCLLVG